MSVQTPSHVILIPSYNTGPRLRDTVECARHAGWPVIVVIDGGTDATVQDLSHMAASDAGLFVHRSPHNEGKGAAILHGLRLARSLRFTHALTMDADGQHSAAHVGVMITASLGRPDAMILGVPLFDATAPRIRVLGHKIANFWTGVVSRRAAPSAIHCSVSAFIRSARCWRSSRPRPACGGSTSIPRR